MSKTGGDFNFYTIMNCTWVLHKCTHCSKLLKDIIINSKQHAEILPQRLCLYTISATYNISERDIFYPHTTPTPLPAHFYSNPNSVIMAFLRFLIVFAIGKVYSMMFNNLFDLYESGISMSKQIQMLKGCNVFKEPEANNEYLEKLENIREGKFIHVIDFSKRYASRQ